MPTHAFPVVKGAHGCVLEVNLNARLCAVGDVRLDLRQDSGGEEDDGGEEFHADDGEVSTGSRIIKGDKRMCVFEGKGGRTIMARQKLLFDVLPTKRIFTRFLGGVKCNDNLVINKKYCKT